MVRSPADNSRVWVGEAVGVAWSSSSGVLCISNWDAVNIVPLLHAQVLPKHEDAIREASVACKVAAANELCGKAYDVR